METGPKISICDYHRSTITASTGQRQSRESVIKVSWGQDGEDAVSVAADLLQGGLNSGDAAQVEEADCEVPEGGYDLGSLSDVSLVVVFSVDGVADLGCRLVTACTISLETRWPARS